MSRAGAGFSNDHVMPPNPRPRLKEALDALQSPAPPPAYIAVAGFDVKGGQVSNLPLWELGVCLWAIILFRCFFARLWFVYNR